MWVTFRPAVFRATQFGRVCLNTGYTSGLRRPSPKSWTLLGGVRFIAWRQKRAKKGNADGARDILGTVDVSGLRPCDRTHLKNGFVPYSYAGGAYDKYRLVLFFCWLWLDLVVWPRLRDLFFYDSASALFTIFSHQLLKNEFFWHTIYTINAISTYKSNSLQQFIWLFSRMLSQNPFNFPGKELNVTYITEQ